MKIEFQSVTKKFGSVCALDQVSLVIDPGQVVVLLGANGAGKTTMLRILAGIAATDSGKLLYDGEPFIRGRLDLRRRLLFIPDFPAVFEDWTPLRHIGMVLQLYEQNHAGIEDRVIELLRDFDLLPLVNAPFLTLSRGQRYKAALVAMLAANPEIWLLDEPFASGMDPHGINALKRHAATATANGRTVIYSTQILDAAERFSDRVCVIHRGTVRAFEPTAELRQRSEGDVSALDEIFAQLREKDPP